MASKDHPTSKEAGTGQSKAPSIKVPENKLLDQYEGKSYEDVSEEEDTKRKAKRKKEEIGQKIRRGVKRAR